MLFFRVSPLHTSLKKALLLHFFKSLVLPALMASFPIVLYAQEPVVQFKHLDISDGFSDNRISHVVQDKNGIIWAATRLGIDRYDGDKVTTYPLSSVATIHDLKLIGRDNIVVATNDGLFKYHNEKDQFQRYNVQSPGARSLLDTEVFCISSFDTTDFWVGGEKGSLFHIKADQKIEYFNIGDLNKSFPNSHITSLSKNKAGWIWMATGNGEVWRFNPKTKELIALEEFDNSSYINDILIDSQGHLWIATLGNGLYKYSFESKELSHYKASSVKGKSINNNVVLGLYQGNDDRIYIGTDGGGINLFEPEKDHFTYFKQEVDQWALSDNSILFLSEGMHNMIFTGSVHGGINYFEDRINVYNVPPERLSFGTDKQGSQILEDNEATLWITAGRNGLRRYNPSSGHVTIFTDNKNDSLDLEGDIVLAMEEDTSGRIWIGTLRGGLNIYDKKQKRFLGFPEKKNIRPVYVIQEGPNNTIWVGTTNGILVFNESLQIVQRLNTRTLEGLSDNRITSIYRDAKGEMWVGTQNGLNVLSEQGELLQHFNSSKNDSTSLSGNHILSINEGPDLSVYVGTYGYGLNRYSRRDESFERFGVKEGLANKTIWGILIDNHKNIWLSTNFGLTRIKNDAISHFGIGQGIPSFHGGDASLSSSGHIYFAGSEGLSYFKPESLHQETSQPRVFFTSFTIGEEDGSRELDPVSILNSTETKELVLQSDYSFFTANFSSSNYFDLEDNQYYYKLEGLDEEWQALNKRKSITFSNLAPKKYNLRVATRNGTAGHSFGEGNIQFKVLPSFWERQEVQGISIIAFGLVVFFIAQWRNRTIRKQRDSFKQIVAIRTREVEKEKDRAYKKELELLETEKQNEQLKQKRLSYELQLKTEELTNTTLRTVHKNNLLVEIKQDFIAEGKKNAEHKKFFQNIVNKIDDSLDIDDEWKQFYTIFNQVHPGFIPDLKKETPSLTDRELRLCALIKLNFPSQQIATLFGISLNSIKVARHRLRKKLKIEEGTSFEEFFESQGL